MPDKVIPEKIKKKISDAAYAERIYEPKYGGKDHSGYDTLMKYEVNDDREECFEKGAIFGYSLSADQLTKANQEIERLKLLLRAERSNNDDFSFF